MPEPHLTRQVMIRAWNHISKTLVIWNKFFQLLMPFLITYQAGVWGSGLEPQPSIPSPSMHGWKQDNPNSMWEPMWITQGEANKECREFVKCSCKAVCTRCKCATAIHPFVQLQLHKQILVLIIALLYSLPTKS